MLCMLYMQLFDSYLFCLIILSFVLRERVVAGWAHTRPQVSAEFMCSGDMS